MITGTMSEKPPNRRKLPLGVEDFQTIRGEDYYYVDKTSFIRDLVEGGRRYFLSRPRRFGKSLLVHTLKDLFEGRESLFQGLDIHGHWDWSVQHPVVRLSFGAKYIESGDVERSILNQLAIIERNAGIRPEATITSGPERLQDLLDRLHRATGEQVVVLVDEYDKPILDVLENPELAKANRDYLRGFYGVIKDSTELVRFVFVTGVSMFSKVSLFSGLNNLKDISLDPQYATLCGYTDEDIDTVFAPELPGLDRDEIRTWYNGYHWRGGKKAYNPYDVLLLFDNREFDDYWFETGTPTFLYELMQERNVNPLELENCSVGTKLLSKLDVGDIDLHALMFQTGYLTIAEEERIGPSTFYRLEYPNLEVRQSFSEGLLLRLGEKGIQVSDRGQAWLAQLAANDFEGFAERFQSYVAGLAHHWWEGPAELGQYESHYAAMLYLTLHAVGAQVQPEEASSRGRSDLVIRHAGQVFVLELKVVEGESEAQEALDASLAQIRERSYAEKYRAGDEPAHLIGLVFGKEERNLLRMRAEAA